MASPFDISLQEAASFDNGFFRFTTIAGPNRLARFGNSNLPPDIQRVGRFWLYANELAEILGNVGSGKDLIRKASRRWAVCDDWGDMGTVWIMDIPKGQEVPACWGAAKFQPKVSAWGQKHGWRETRRSYEGGSLQLIVPMRDENNVVNPWLKSLTRGPIPTDLLATDPGKFLK